MNPIAHLFYAPVTTITGVVESARRTFSKDKAADCVFIIGPGLETSSEKLAWKAFKEGLNVVFIGDGRTDITMQMIQKAREDGIIGGRTEVIGFMHGGLRRQNESRALGHVMQIGNQINNSGEKIPTLISTKDFIRCLREPLPKKSGNLSNTEKWQGNIHISSCHVGALKREVDTDEKTQKNKTTKSPSLWRDGDVLLYASSKQLSAKACAQNFDSLLESLGKRKRHQSNEKDSSGELSADISQVFQDVKKTSAETIVFLDKNREQPEIFRAPKTLREVMPDHLNGRWRQSDANEKSDKNYIASQFNDSEKTKKSTFNPDRELSNRERKKVIGFIWTRLMHLQNNEKFKKLKADLKESPWLANIKTSSGNTPLSFLAAIPKNNPNSGVGSGEIARALIDAGAKIDARYEGKTVLEIAAEAGNTEVLTVLLEKLKESGKLSRENLSSSLRLACLAVKNRSEMVKEILSRSSKGIINQRDLSGRTALHHAIMQGDVETVKLLLDAGADFSKRTLGFKSPAGLAREIGGEISENILSLLRQAKVKKTNASNQRGVVLSGKN